MRIAILSDIHGNFFALEAVIKQIHNMQVDRIYFLGDLLGYYYEPKKVYQKLREINATMILGNHEQMLFDCIDGKINIEHLTSKYGSGHKIALEQLSSSEIESLRNLPTMHVETIDGLTIACYHGSPFDNNYYLYPDTNNAILSACVTGADFTFVGHSHYSYIAKLKNGLLINVGSVGQSRVEGGIANWCILNLGNSVIEMQTTLYDIKPLLDLVEKNDPAISYLSSILKRRKNEK